MNVEGPIEVELKYRVVDEAAVARFVTDPVLGPFTAIGGARASQYEDRYLDTRDGALEHAGFSARLRQMHATTVVNVKSTQQSEGSLQRRTELEGPADRTLAPIAWPPSPARSLILELCGDVPLIERVMIRQLRRKRRLRAGETTVEVSLDEVDVLSRTQLVDRFVELEIELISGDEAPLLALRELLDADPVLRPSKVSKLQAGLSAIYGGRRTGTGRKAQAEVARAERAAAVERSSPKGRGSEGPSDDAAATDGVAAKGSDSARGSAPAKAGEPPRGTESAPAMTSARPSESATIVQIPVAEAIPSNGAGSNDRADQDDAAPGVSNSLAHDIPMIPLAVDSSPVEDSETDSPTTVAAPILLPGRSARPRGAGADTGKRRSKHDRAGDGTTDAPSDEVPERPPLIVGRTPGVTADDVVAEAGRKVLRFHLARLIDRENGTRLGTDPEELHAMRVATRRMRAAWRVFGDGYRPESTRKYRNRLRDVAGKLGAVRDLDVLVMALEKYRADLPADEQAGLQPLVADWIEQREEARAVLIRELDSNGYRRFVDDYRTFVLSPGMGAAVVGPTEPHHVRDTAGSRIMEAYERVRAYQAVLRWADVATLHQLRIAGKWLRYTLEFVREALGPDAAMLIERVVALQDHLGLLNDAEVAATKARALLVERPGQLSEAETAAIGRYLVAQEREVVRLHRAVGAPWRGLSGTVFRRGLGRAVAAL